MLNIGFEHFFIFATFAASSKAEVLEFISRSGKNHRQAHKRNTCRYTDVPIDTYMHTRYTHTHIYIYIYIKFGEAN